MLKNWGYEKLAKVEYHESIGEMKHADKMLDLFVKCVGYFHLTHDPNIGVELDFAQNWVPEVSMLN